MGSSASGAADVDSAADAAPEDCPESADARTEPACEAGSSCGSGSGHLDEGAFEHFAPLLAATQEYAVHSGCRFRISSFDELPTDEAASKQAVGEADAAHRAAMSDKGFDPGCRHHSHQIAKLRSAPTVHVFRERLQAGDDELHRELIAAMRIVMAESVRNAMIAAFRELEMWPPAPQPAGLAEDDCDYEDVSAPIPVIAQRCFHDEARRRADAPQHDETCGGTPQPGRRLRCAMTASFLIDFATEAGSPIPPAPESHLNTLKEFGARLSEYEQDQKARSAASAAFIGGFGVGAENGEEAGGWFSSAQSVAWDTVSGIFVGVASNAGIDLVRRGSDRLDVDPQADQDPSAPESDAAPVPSAPGQQGPTSSVLADVFQCAMRPNKVPRLQPFSMGAAATERRDPDFTPSTCTPPGSTSDSPSTHSSHYAALT